MNNKGGRLTTLFLFLPPALVIFTVFVIFPLIDAGYYSFFKWNGNGEPTNYIGIRNFQLVAKHSVFATAIWNTMKVILVSIFIQLPLALAAALAIYHKTWHSNVFRLIFFLPFILAEVATGLIWRFVYDGNYGIVSNIADFLGQETVFLLSDKSTAFLAILLVIVWKYFGFHMMIYIAGLQSIPKEMIEAALIDGANRWQTVWYIKIPSIMSSIRVSIFLSILGGLQLFDVIIPLAPRGGPGHSAQTIVTYLYHFGLVRSKVGFGSAIGLILFVFAVIFAFTYQKYVMKSQHQA